jgi:hypothetical protein
LELLLDSSFEVLVARSAATGSLRFPDLAVATFALLNFLSGCAGGASSPQSVNPNTYTISGTISPSSGGSGSTLTLSGPTAGSTTADGSGNYSFTGLANGTYVVSPTHSGYTFSPSLQTVTINGTNATGVNFTATQTSNSVALSWIASVSVVSGYNVYRGITNGGPYTKINSSLITTLSYTDSSVSSGNTYYYVCKSVDSQGVESIYSNQATAQIP